MFTQLQQSPEHCIGAVGLPDDKTLEHLLQLRQELLTKYELISFK